MDDSKNLDEMFNFATQSYRNERINWLKSNYQTNNEKLPYELTLETFKKKL